MHEKVTFTPKKVTFSLLKVTFRIVKVILSSLKVTFRIVKVTFFRQPRHEHQFSFNQLFLLRNKMVIFSLKRI